MLPVKRRKIVNLQFSGKQAWSRLIRRHVFPMKLNQPFCVLCWVTALALTAIALTVRGEDASAEKLPEGLSVVAIEARPAAVELKHKFDYRQLLISGKLATGETVDLTRMAKPSNTGEAASVSSDGLVRAAKDGESKITYAYGRHSVDIPVKV